MTWNASPAWWNRAIRENLRFRLPPPARLHRPDPRRAARTKETVVATSVAEIFG